MPYQLCSGTVSLNDFATKAIQNSYFKLNPPHRTCNCPFDKSLSKMQEHIDNNIYFYIQFLITATDEFCAQPEAYHCSDTYCIPSKWQCDQVNDCPDNSDELNCPDIEHVTLSGLDSTTILSPGYPGGYYSNTDQVRSKVNLLSEYIQDILKVLMHSVLNIKFLIVVSVLGIVETILK